MWEFKRAKKHLETEYGPLAVGGEQLPKLFEEVGGLGIELACDDFSSDDGGIGPDGVDHQALMNYKAVGQMLQMHQDPNMAE